MTHGTAILKEDIFDTDNSIKVPKNTKGVVTAYLPEQDMFAVMFTNEEWISFNMTEEEFKNKVDYNE